MRLNKTLRSAIFSSLVKNRGKLSKRTRVSEEKVKNHHDDNGSLQPHVTRRYAGRFGAIDNVENYTIMGTYALYSLSSYS